MSEVREIYIVRDAESWNGGPAVAFPGSPEGLAGAERHAGERSRENGPQVVVVERLEPGVKVIRRYEAGRKVPAVDD